MQQGVPLAGLMIPTAPPKLVSAAHQFTDSPPLGALAKDLVVHAIRLKPDPLRVPCGMGLASAHEPPQDRAIMPLAIERKHADAADLVPRQQGLDGACPYLLDAAEVLQADFRQCSPKVRVRAQSTTTSSHSDCSKSTPMAAFGKQPLPPLDITELDVVHALSAARVGYRGIHLLYPRQVWKLVEVGALHVDRHAAEPKRVSVPWQEVPRVRLPVRMSCDGLREGVVT
mmetsp:Transcript_56705/g.143650  ORF Transcript_56705/g.143650 Transcript_56705/m.143650 type:complete len:228 (-) Transcript_56705:715-1398(-)